MYVDCLCCTWEAISDTAFSLYELGCGVLTGIGAEAKTFPTQLRSYYKNLRIAVTEKERTTCRSEGGVFLLVVVVLVFAVSM